MTAPADTNGRVSLRDYFDLQFKAVNDRLGELKEGQKLLAERCLDKRDHDEVHETLATAVETNAEAIKGLWSDRDKVRGWLIAMGGILGFLVLATNIALAVWKA